MRKLASLLSCVALLGVIAPPCLYLADRMTLDRVKLWMLVFTLLWFVTVPLWMDRKKG